MRETQVLKAALADPEAPRRLIAESPAMKWTLELIRQVSASAATVLLQGESGTGKELLARAIHAGSPRCEHSLIALNCAALPEGLQESELFGYEKGAFTGATATKPGRFELADGGTLFLDEVADLAPATQAKLLRVLQEGEIQRLGGTRTLRVEVRIVAATNQDLARLVQDRRFREDLYYRLNGVAIRVPPLRERPEDLLPLAEHFLERYSRKVHKGVKGFSPEALTRMRQYRWPGNVRELEHAVERAVLLARGPEITSLALGLYPAGEHHVIAGPPQGPTLDDLDRHRVLDALERCDRNRSEAAKLLGIGRTTLWRKLRQYGYQA